MAVRVRFAPSPTGYLHVGGARTALFNWLFAKSLGGKFILRIEDTDQSRSTKESIEEIKESLSWLGLGWDEYYRQTDRANLYENRANELIATNYIYESDGALWFKIPGNAQIVVQDQVLGDVQFQTNELKDFVIRRSDGTFTYNFACAVDDANLNITHVMRGDDHLNNTPKQILIYSALDQNPPKFAHFPMILGKDGKRLSKRHGATSVLSYRKRGFLPEGLINFLARLGWSHGDQEIFSREELIDYFSLENVGGSSAVFDEEKLLWINHEWLQKKEPEEIGNLLKDFLIKEKLVSKDNLDNLNRIDFVKMATLMRERNKTLLKMAEAGKFAIVDHIDYSKAPVQKHLSDKTRNLVKGLASELSNLDDSEFEAKKIEETTRDFLKENDGSLGDIAQLCRVALTGRRVSPGLFQTMELAGKRKTLDRLKEVTELH